MSAFFIFKRPEQYALAEFYTGKVSLENDFEFLFLF